MLADFSNPGLSVGYVAKDEVDRAAFAKPSDAEIQFPFPFKPYDIQLEFMKNLYDALENGKLGIFESPTGTGKSLSLICGALTWLRDHEERKRGKLERDIEEARKSLEELEKAIDEANQVKDKKSKFSDWLDVTADKCKKKNELTELKLQQLKYEKVDSTIKDLRKIKNKKKVSYARNSEIDQMLGDIQKMKQAIDSEFQVRNDAVEEDIILREYNSDEEDATEETNRRESGEDEDDIDSHITKIYYCSRTHSQLSQFVSEVKKSPFASDARVVPLSSRQNSCINDAVLNLKSQSLINNRCIEMQKNKGKETKQSTGGEVLKKKKTTCGCPFYRQSGIEAMRDNILVEISEIEDLTKQGRKSKTCPYYSTRQAVPLAQLVVLPYNTLLHKSTREACGIVLDGNVVIIDEAHNLLDAVSNIHSCQITGSQLTGALSQLQQYMERYSSRFSPKNLFHIKQIIFILQIFIKLLHGKADQTQGVGKAQETTQVMTLNQFVIDTQIDNLNFYDILRFCKKSEISRKLMGFSEIYQPSVKKLEDSNAKRSSVSLFLDQLCGKKSAEQSDAPQASAKKPPPSSPLQLLEEFFRCLNNHNEDGRIFLNRQATLETSSIKYSLMNPANHFQEIVSKARAVIVAGGTMQPIEEFSEQLFQAAGGQKDRIFTFSCGTNLALVWDVGHVIPASNLVALALAQGPSGRDLDFSYQNRSSPELKTELGRLILNVCNVVPGGVVCFFSSYEYGEVVIAHWKKSGILQKMEEKKTVFKEPRKASEINDVLSEYSKRIWKSRSGSSTGAILFSIVGGKMSEGINFSDDLARCIIMVGMPYPNIKSPELQEKIKYLNANTLKRLSGNMPGQVYYENLCMKAVNQSIGRAIRHKDDYASILLLDKRYARSSVQNALPGWIKDRLNSHPTFGPAFADIRKFFHGKR